MREVVHVSTSWTAFHADQGNQPGANRGDVLVELVEPVSGEKVFRVPSGSVTVAAEQGQLVGVQVTLGDGRRMWLPATNVAAVIDAPNPP